LPTVDANIRAWNDRYRWPEQGDEWSEPWGGAELQWLTTILPRIRAFLPAETILEIAPGHGRWTQFLKNYCKRLIMVDVAENCIEACQRRFSSDSHISYYVNDGRSLNMVSNESVDFVFSFDSLVHAEADVIKAYLTELAAKMKPNGAGFIHHSNIGAYPRSLAFAKKVPEQIRNFKVLNLLLNAFGKRPPIEPRTSLIIRGFLINTSNWRAESMTGALFEEFCRRAGLRCICQERINWGHGRHLTDCFSVFTREGSIWDRPTQIIKNPNFMLEARRVSELARVYPSKQ
jgi:ubiquinone/menaquinone biosynthesis C-methylase UbiE